MRDPTGDSISEKQAIGFLEIIYIMVRDLIGGYVRIVFYRYFWSITKRNCVSARKIEPTICKSNNLHLMGSILQSSLSSDRKFIFTGSPKMSEEKFIPCRECTPFLLACFF